MSGLSFILDFSPEVFDLLNLILNVINVIIVLTGYILFIVVFIRNKLLQLKIHPSMNDLSDDEFLYLDKHFIMSQSNIERNHRPKSAEDEVICDKLLSNDVFSKNKNLHYKITKPWKREINSIKRVIANM